MSKETREVRRQERAELAWKGRHQPMAKSKKKTPIMHQFTLETRWCRHIFKWMCCRQQKKDELAKDEIKQLRQEVADRRIAMHNIYWLNLAPQIEGICKTVYKKWGGPREGDEESNG